MSAHLQADVVGAVRSALERISGVLEVAVAEPIGQHLHATAFVREHTLDVGDRVYDAELALASQWPDSVIDVHIRVRRDRTPLS